MNVKRFTYPMAISATAFALVSCLESHTETAPQSSEQQSQLLVATLFLEYPENVAGYARIAFDDLNLDTVTAAASGVWRTEDLAVCRHPCCEAAAGFFQSGGRWTVQFINDSEVKIYLRRPAVDSSFEIDIRLVNNMSGRPYGEWHLVTDCGELKGSVEAILPVP